MDQLPGYIIVFSQQIRLLFIRLELIGFQICISNPTSAGPELVPSICKCLKVNLHSQSGLIHQLKCMDQICFAFFQYKSGLHRVCVLVGFQFDIAFNTVQTVLSNHPPSFNTRSMIHLNEHKFRNMLEIKCLSLK